MARNKKRGRRGSAETDLQQAFERVRDGRPVHPDNIQSAAEGRLPMNASVVAKEAGRSRTLISGANCRFPEIRDAIATYSVEPGEERKTSSALVKTLRAKNSDLRVHIGNLESQMALLVAKNIDLEDRLALALRELEKARGKRLVPLR